jgi:hypothetical protein
MQAFDGNEELCHALKDAFEALINVRQVARPRFLLLPLPSSFSSH